LGNCYRTPSAHNEVNLRISHRVVSALRYRECPQVNESENNVLI